MNKELERPKWMRKQEPEPIWPPGNYTVYRDRNGVWKVEQDFVSRPACYWEIPGWEPPKPPKRRRWRPGLGTWTLIALSAATWKWGLQDVATKILIGAHVVAVLWGVFGWLIAYPAVARSRNDWYWGPPPSERMHWDN